jgi:FAD/FMN-containing dehydrogenase
LSQSIGAPFLSINGYAWIGGTLPGMQTLAAPPPAIRTHRSAGAHRAADRGVVVNDVHSRQNSTTVAEIIAPRREEEVIDVIRRVSSEGSSLAVSGSRHAMGGQQFASGERLIDIRSLKRVITLDPVAGHIEVEAGIQWRELIEACHALQVGEESPWTIRQKQTGADDFTMGGSLAANIHGRGLAMRPFVDDVESFTIVDATGELRVCSRTENADLFRLVAGGYGLFGIVTRITLRLARRTKVRRLVEIVGADELVGRITARQQEGCRYGDFQFCIDEQSQDFLRRGVMSCYQDVALDIPISAGREISPAGWLQLFQLAYTDRREGFRRYSEHYRSTTGQTYWSDTHQLSHYVSDYAEQVSRAGGVTVSPLMISELYVPREALPEFLNEAARLLRRNHVPVMYGTVRFIEQDVDSFLRWARQSFACVIVNIPAQPHGSGSSSAEVFRALIDLAAGLGGSYYLTYHRHALRVQVERCYPEFSGFLRQKRLRDPQGIFQSDWYRHYAGVCE